MRHPVKGAIELAAKYCKVPLINAGDGCGEHPTQALLDIYTIINEHKKFPNGMNICVVGDLKHGRTVHSLIYLLGLYENIHITAVSPDGFWLPDDVLKFITEKKMGLSIISELDTALIEKPDVIYLTRLQKERFEGNCETTYTFQEKHIELLKKDAIIMHPLPRNAELSTDVDKYEKHAAYFRQAENGLRIRAAILKMLFI